MLTIGQAARAANRSKSTIWRDVKSGRLSANRNADGTFAINEAELARVYPDTPSNAPETSRRNRPARPENGVATALERENALLREMLDDVREDRDRWRAQAERLLLAAPADKPAAPEKRRRWWWPIRPR